MIPDVAMASDVVMLVDESMTCPMEAATICPPSLTSSPERQLRNDTTIDLSLAPIVLRPVVLRVPSVSMLSSWDNVFSIVPLSIAASSVLRI